MEASRAVPLFSILILCSFNGTAQYTFDKGSHNFLLGYGFQNWYANDVYKSLPNEIRMDDEYLNASAHQYSTSKSVNGPFFFRYEYAYKEKLGLGLVLGYSDFAVSATNNYTYATPPNEKYYNKLTQNFTSYTLGVRMNYHFLKDKRIDPYVGCAAGYNYSKSRYLFETNNPGYIGRQKTEQEETELPVYLAASIGARFYLLDFLALYGEIGADKYSFIQAGLVYKLNKHT